MTKHLGKIDTLRDVMHILYPMMSAYYKVKGIVEQLEKEDEK
jgi:hypothetical protein